MKTTLAPFLTAILAASLATACSAAPTPSEVQVAPADDASVPPSPDGGATSPDASAGDAAPDAPIVTQDAAHDGGATHDAGPDAATCPAGSTDCGQGPPNGCKTLDDDPKNCGACGHDCTALAHIAGGVSCAAGKCVVPPSACAKGYAHCSQNVDDGCETDISTAAHCGSCTTTCASSTPVCAASGGGYACTSGCPAGTPDLCGSSCVDERTNAQHCGSCSNACPAPTHAQPTCAASTCGFSCNGGYHACGGACADNASPQSCGSACTPCAAPANAQATCDGTSCGFACNGGYHACGSACDDNGSINSCGASCTPCQPPPNSVATCNGTSCGFTCNGGFHACGSACDDNNSINSCGSSCTPCAVPPNTTGATCDGTKCGYAACLPGFADCDGNVANGCEVNLGNDPKNCGTCGHDCLGGACGTSTTKGVCQPLVLTGASSPSHILVDATNVYYETGGTLYAVPKRGGAVRASPSTTYRIVGIAEDAANVYAATVQPAVLSWSKSTGALTNIYVDGTGATPTGIAASGSTVYWTTQQGPVNQINPDGSGYQRYPGPTSNFNGVWATTSQVTADATGPYFTGTFQQAVPTGMYNGVMRLDRVFIGTSGVPGSIATNGTSLAWLLDDGTMWTSKNDGSGVAQIATGTGNTDGLAADATYVYRALGPALQRVPIAGGAPAIMWGPPNVNVRGVAVDEKAVYFTDFGFGVVYLLAK